MNSQSISLTSTHIYFFIWELMLILRCLRWEIRLSAFINQTDLLINDAVLWKRLQIKWKWSRCISIFHAEALSFDSIWGQRVLWQRLEQSRLSLFFSLPLLKDVATINALAKNKLSSDWNDSEHSFIRLLKKYWPQPIRWDVYKR